MQHAVNDNVLSSVFLNNLGPRCCEEFIQGIENTYNKGIDIYPKDVANANIDQVQNPPP